jgi:hypothetical protein
MSGRTTQKQTLAFVSVEMGVYASRLPIGHFWHVPCITKVTCDGQSEAGKSQVPRSKTMKAKLNAKLAIRIAVLTVGMIGAFVVASFQPMATATDGGPFILCPPKSSNCQSALPPMNS